MGGLQLAPRFEQVVNFRLDSRFDCVAVLELHSMQVRGWLAAHLAIVVRLCHSCRRILGGVRRV
eukprot:CAMPEP_0172760292 /NCGR_PEP_ID=MMETSP1074-20121228/169307_1 /TAXON_ID=2916 /ORGANISM="Ceratium fusus, Strain PA161109" /LENGTH=63 /DNA_ID=CAMNT_0013594235 /DNA_START=367 /DNA_END=555 /DNA_ORIENTATION=+